MALDAELCGFSRAHHLPSSTFGRTQAPDGRLEERHARLGSVEDSVFISLPVTRTSVPVISILP